jgi:hypothetical protein
LVTGQMPKSVRRGLKATKETGKFIRSKIERT